MRRRNEFLHDIVCFAISALVGVLAAVAVIKIFGTPGSERREWMHRNDNETVYLAVDSSELTDSVLACALAHYGVEHADIVLAQARLETGNYKSSLCLESNNLFGLYCTPACQFYRFDHWTNSVIAYKNMVQYKYDGGDYFDFLERIGYAEDPDYVSKLKSVTEHVRKKQNQNE